MKVSILTVIDLKPLLFFWSFYRLNFVNYVNLYDFIYDFMQSICEG